MSVAKGIELLFDRPNETLITPKGENDTVFQLTEQYLVRIFLYSFFL